jgi:hypothetical protein
MERLLKDGMGSFVKFVPHEEIDKASFIRGVSHIKNESFNTFTDRNPLKHRVYHSSR